MPRQRWSTRITARREDFKKLEQYESRRTRQDRRGLLTDRYFRGVKAFVAQEHGAAGLIIYSDPADDGWRRGDKYPEGPWRPATGVQRGSIGYMFQFPGDPTTPGIASVPSLPDDKRTPPEQSAIAARKIPTHSAVSTAMHGPSSKRSPEGQIRPETDIGVLLLPPITFGLWAA